MNPQNIKKFNTISWLILITAVVFCLSITFGLGIADAAWNGTAGTSFASGSGTEASPYLIKTEMQLAYFIKCLNDGVTFENKHISLRANLDMTGNTWEYGSSAAFGGTFVGNAYTVKTDCTIFPNIQTAGSIVGLNVEAKETVTRSILCINNSGLIQMCCVRGNVFDEDNDAYAGMICTYNYGTVQYCGAIGSVFADGNGSDPAAWAALVARNKKTVDACFAALTVEALGSSKYNLSHEDPLANGGTATNSYYDATLYKATTTKGKGITTEEMKSNPFLTLFASNAIPGYGWIKGSDGYPTLTTCGTASASIQNYTDETTVFHTSSLKLKMLSSSGSGTIYYTTDGSDPRSSGTRKTYSSSSGVTIYGDTELMMAVYSGSQYGPITRKIFVKLEGSGTSSSPYLISTKRQLDAIRHIPDAHYKLTVDLAYTDADFVLGGIAAGGWVAIPTFSGIFDGNAHAIIGLRGTQGGLVGNNSGTITSLRMIDHQLSNHYNSGAIADHNSGTITRCYAKSAYSKEISEYVSLNSAASSYIGGIVGSNTGTITHCQIDGVVVANAAWQYGSISVGGIAGYSSRQLSSCISNATLATSIRDYYLYAGGIVGSGGCWIENSRSNTEFILNASLSYSYYVGGIAGGHLSSLAEHCISNTYAIKGTQQLGSGAYKYTYATSDRYCYNAENSLLPADCPELDFTETWMITDEGIIPQGVMDAEGHCYRFVRYIAEPSCTSNGEVLLRCDLCAKEKQCTITTPGHVEVTDSAKDPSCTETGLTEGSHCQRCNQVFAAQQTVEKKPHSYENYFCTACHAEASYYESGECGDRLTWTVYKDGTLVIRGTGKMWDYDYYNHMEIPWVQNHISHITKIIVEAGVTSIGDAAFSYLGPQKISVEIANTVKTIGKEAFRQNTGITTIHIPASVQNLGEHAFLWNDNLEAITVDPSNKYFSVDESGVLYNKNKTHLIRFCEKNVTTSYAIPEGVVSIAPKAFDNANYLKEVALPSTLTTIGDYAFSEINYLEEIVISDTTTSIGECAFYSCASLKKALIPKNVTVIGDNAFNLCASNFAIHGYTGTTSHSYAKSNSIPFVPLNLHAEMPTLTTVPVPAEYIFGETAAALSVATSVTDGGILSYQWYESSSADADAGMPIEGATSDSFIPDVSSVGVRYYYAVATNTNEELAGTKTSSAATPIVAITVHAKIDAAIPEISMHPASAFYVAGNTALPLTVAASVADGGTLSYQWYKNTINDYTDAVAIEGATSENYTPSLEEPGYNYYFVVVTNSNPEANSEKTASSNSQIAIIAIAERVDVAEPEITLQPVSAEYTQGDSTAELTITAQTSDGGRLTYQWYESDTETNTDGRIIADAVSANFTPPTDVPGMKYYYVVVTNTNLSVNGTQTASAASEPVAVFVKYNAAAPVITQQPASGSYLDQQAVELSLTASGGSLSYQWYVNTENNSETGTAIPNATAEKYHFTPDFIGKQYYYVIITNKDETATGEKETSVISDIAEIHVTLRVNAVQPTISLQPVSAEYTVDNPANQLTVSASVADEGTLSYQWYVHTENSNIGGSKIDEATEEQYAPPTDRIGTKYYYVVVTNTNSLATGEKIASASSEVAAITVIDKVDAAVPVITVQPQTAVYPYGNSIVPLCVDAAASDNGQLTYQWYVNETNSNANGTLIEGATEKEYTPEIKSPGIRYYYVRITNTNLQATGEQKISINSLAVAIMVMPPMTAAAPEISTHPISTVYTVGDAAIPLTVEASISDNGQLSYQWYEASSASDINGIAIPGATDTSYLPDVTVPGVRYYYVVVTNTNTTATNNQVVSVVSELVSYTVKSKGVTINGTVISGGFDQITLQLMQNNTAAYTVQVTGRPAAFKFNEVPAGTYDLHISSAGCLDYVIKDITVADADLDLTKHANENIAEIKLIAGDLNHDGSIDANDLAIIRAAENYGHTVVEDGVNVLCDLNGDGMINIFDSAYLRGLYGRTCRFNWTLP